MVQQWSRAKTRGQHMGRPPALTPQQQAEARQRRLDGALLKELTKNYNFSLVTISRLSKSYRLYVNHPGLGETLFK